MKIVTLTLSPAFDIHCYAPAFEMYHENLVTVTSRDAGGKGINISRALTQNGVKNEALVVLGKENADEFRAALAAESLSMQELLVKGRIRENITLHTDGNPETRLSFHGFVADGVLLSRVEEAIGDVDSDTVITLTGRIPCGVPMSDMQAFLHRLHDKGARIVIDSRSFFLKDLVDARPWLVKPNEEELFAYVWQEVRSFEDALVIARGMHERGIANAMISMGEKGACLACDEGEFIAEPPCVEVRSTVGAGDSAIAGFIAAIAEGKSAPDALRNAVAYGTAACLTEGTQPPRGEDIAWILDKVELHS